MKKILFPIAVIVGLNLLAHFLPFERAFVAWDDLQSMVEPLAPNWSRWDFIRSYMIGTERPLVISWVVLDWLVEDHPIFWVLVPFLTSSLLAVSAYFLTEEMTRSPSLSLICSGFFVLLPNKPQLYSHVVYSTINVVYTVTVASLFLFLVYLKNANRVCLWVSLVCYAASLFWYEAGAFLPLILITAALLYDRRRLAASLLFFLPLALKLLWTGHLWVQGIASRLDHPLMYFWNHIFVTLPNLYFGRQMIKWVLYGLYRFPFMEFPWAPLLLVIDGLVLFGFFRWLRKQPPRFRSGRPSSPLLWWSSF